MALTTTIQDMTTLEGYLGKRVSAQFEKLQVFGVIVDMRRVMGRVDWLFRPESGEGRQWVTENRIQVLEEQL